MWFVPGWASCERNGGGGRGGPASPLDLPWLSMETWLIPCPPSPLWAFVRSNDGELDDPELLNGLSLVIRFKSSLQRDNATNIKEI